MVGDGVNDAAALAAADVGIAVRGGAAASLAAAPVMIANAELTGVVDLLNAARRTRRTILRNFAVSISYNAFAVTLAITGFITPLVAAVLMPISSVSVLAMTLVRTLIQQSSPHECSLRCPADCPWHWEQLLWLPASSAFVRDNSRTWIALRCEC